MTTDEFKKLQAGAVNILAAKADIDHVIADFRARLYEKILDFDAVCASEALIAVNNGYRPSVTAEDIDDAMKRLTPRILSLTHMIVLATERPDGEVG